MYTSSFQNEKTNISNIGISNMADLFQDGRHAEIELANGQIQLYISGQMYISFFSEWKDQYM